MNIEDVKLHQWYTYDDSEQRTYGYTFLYPVMKFQMAVSFVLIAFVWTKEGRDLFLDIVWMEEGESLVDWYDRTPSNEDLIPCLFNAKADIIERTRNLIKRNK